MTSPGDLTISALAERLRSGDLRARDLVDACLAHIEAR